MAGSTVAVAVVIGQKLKTFVAANGLRSRQPRGSASPPPHVPGNKWALQISKQSRGVGPEPVQFRGRSALLPWAGGGLAGAKPGQPANYFKQTSFLSSYNSLAMGRNGGESEAESRSLRLRKPVS